MAFDDEKYREIEENNALMVQKNDYSVSDVDIDELDNVVGADFLTQIQIDLRNDVLYKILKKSNRHTDIITKEMTEQLKEGILYSTPETSELLGVPASTMRGWIQDLEDYIQPEVQGRFIKLDPKAIYKIRMIAMLRDNNEYAVGHIKEITLGVEVMQPGGDEKEASINQRVAEMEKQLEWMASTIDKQSRVIAQQGSMLWQFFDYELFNKEGKVQLNPNSIVPLIEESNSKKYEEIKEEVKNELKLDIDNEIQEFKRINEDTIRSYSREEVHKIFEERKSKGLLSRLFGKK